MSTDMRRRDFLRNAAGAGAALGTLGGRQRPTPLAAADGSGVRVKRAFPQVQKLTDACG